MRKHGWAIVLLALTHLFVAQVYAGGLGVSNKNLNETLALGETKLFELGRVYNERDTSLIIKVEWHNQGDGVNVVLKLGDTKSTATIASKILEAGTGAFIYAEVTGMKLGEYAGTVEVSTETVNPVSGNPTLPRGQLTAKFTVGEPLPKTSMPLWIIAPLIVGIVAGVLLIHFKKRKKK